MKVIEDGHVYELKNLEDPGVQTLTFIRRSSKAVDYGDTEHPGTNTQEVLRALIHRTLFLNSIIPCDETMNAVHHLRMALYEYEARAWRRKQEKLNKEAGLHSEQDLNAHRDLYNNVPFSEHEIELMPVGEDGHVIPYTTEQQFERDYQVTWGPKFLLPASPDTVLDFGPHGGKRTIRETAILLGGFLKPPPNWKGTGNDLAEHLLSEVAEARPGFFTTEVRFEHSDAESTEQKG